jgi:tetratricopeptide (TPR) repeat protein
MSGRGREALVAAFDEAERARLVTPAKGTGELMFSHELIRQTLLVGVSAVKRERLHLQAADAISRRYSDDLEAQAGDLAYHLSQAGRFADRASLVRYLTIAGDRAFDAAAFDDAVKHFEQALSLIPAGDQLRRGQLQERLAMAQRSIGRWDEALRIMNKALDCYGALGRAEDIGRLGWAMVYQLVWTARLVEAVQVGQRALAELAESVSADKARLLSALGFAISLSGDYAAATAAFDQARALAEQVGNDRALATFCIWRPSTISATASWSRQSMSACEPPRSSNKTAHCGISAACMDSWSTRTAPFPADSCRPASATRPWTAPSGLVTSARRSLCYRIGSAGPRYWVICRG